MMLLGSDIQVTSVGINTERGLLMASISEDTSEETPLQVRLNGVATFIGIVGLTIAFAMLSFWSVERKILLNLVAEWHAFFAKVWEKRTTSTYTQKEIDEVRGEWADFLRKLCNVGLCSI